MMKREINILWALLFILWGCSDSEIITSYEEVKEVMSPPVPIIFSPYVGTAQEEAATRADLNFLSSYGNDIRYRNIPFKGEQRNTNRRLGHLAYNNYIVGVYGFFHKGSDWATDTNEANIDNLNADFMTNQPLLHEWKDNTVGPYWTYSPTKYWPNNNAAGGTNGYSTHTDKVTFISYYPFQDYEGGEYYKDGTGTSTTDPIATLPTTGTAVTPQDGIGYWTFPNNNTYKQRNNIKLDDCIIPPAKDGNGVDAFTFSFQQKENVNEHIDFLMGINNDLTKQSVTNSVTLNLKHTLCLVRFKVNFYPRQAASNEYLDEMPSSLEWEVNSVTLTGMYDKGTVKPVIENGNVSFDWQLDKNKNKVNYEVFTHASKENNKNNRLYPAYFSNFTLNTGYDPSKPINNNNHKYIPQGENSTGSLSFYTNLQGEGFKWFILALPQESTDDTYIDIDYNLTYTYSGGNEPKTVVYPHCKEHIKVPNTVKFLGGKYLEFTLNFYLKGIKMDAQLIDWDEGESGETVPHYYDTQIENDNNGN